MNAAALLLRLITENDDGDPSTFDYQKKKLRYLGYLNTVYGYVYNTEDYDWKDITVETTVAIGDNFTFLTAEWGGFSEQQRFYREDFEQPCEYKSMGVIMDLRRANSGAGVQDSLYYSIDTGGTLLQVPYVASQPVTYSVFYKAAAEQLTDPDDSTELRIPSRYEHTVIYPALVAMAQLNKSDSRKDWQSIADAGMAQMKGRENPTFNQLKFLPAMRRAGS